MFNAIRFAAACALLVTASFSAFSADTAHDMSSMKGMSDLPGLSKSSDAAPSAKVYHTAGTVKKVTAESVIIAHQPVAELGWPAMTMAFVLPEDGSVPTLTVGEKLAFSFAWRTAGYQLVTVTPLK